MMQQTQIPRDVFGEYLKTKTDNLELAKTDSSYRNKTSNQELVCNEGLATLGDAVLRLGLTHIIHEMDEDKISNMRQQFESDKVLVVRIGKYYHIRRLLKFDNKDKNKQHGYAWGSGRNSSKDSDSKNNHAQKYIATAMEACLGAFYLDNEMSMKSVLNVVSYWMCIIEPELRSNPVMQKYLNLSLD